VGTGFMSGLKKPVQQRKVALEASSVSTRFGFLIETKCVPMMFLSEREQFGHRTFGLA